MNSRDSHSLLFTLVLVNTSGIGMLLLEKHTIAGTLLCIVVVLSVIYSEIENRFNYK